MVCPLGHTILVTMNLACLILGIFPYLTPGIINQTDSFALGLSTDSCVQHVTIYSATDNSDKYANGVVITVFKEKLYCMWQSSPCDEDSPHTHVVFSRSADNGLNWSMPKVLTEASDTAFCTSGGWITHGDTLTAFINVWPLRMQPASGYTYYIQSTDGETWSTPHPVRMYDGTMMAGVLEQDPYTLPDGRIIGATHFQPGLHVCPVYTDDRTGCRGWRKAVFEVEDIGKQSRCIEPSQYIQTDSTLVMMFRDQHSTFKKLASLSINRGETWTTPTETNIPDARTKQCAGNLPDGTAYMVCCPSNGKWRWPLVLLLSHDGITFDYAMLLRSGRPEDLPLRKYDGKYKTIGFNYPKAIVSNGNMYIGYSTNKETVCCTIIPIDKLFKNYDNKN